MSGPIRPETTDSACELAPVTRWPLIIAAASVVGLGIAAASGLLLFDAQRPGAVPVAAVPQPQPPAAEPAPPVRLAPAERSVPRPPSPERIVTVKRVVVREYTPLPAPPVARHRDEAPPVVRLRRRARPAAPDTPPLESWRSRLLRSEESLHQQLLKDSREIDLEAQKGTGKALLADGLAHTREVEKARDKKDGPSPSAPIEELLKKRADLKGLPLRAGKACQTDREQAKVLAMLSPKVRRLQARTVRRLVRERGQTTPYEPRFAYDEASTRALRDFLGKSLTSCEKKELLVGPLEQMYQTEPPAVRSELIRTLGKIKGKQATQALARRAVFDLSQQGRALAVEELKKRDLDDARPVFLEALRHPWPPIADHAALALATLKDDDAAPHLRKLLDAPDPAAPYRDPDGKWFRKELVRVNHLRNCLLCHPPSASVRDAVRGPIPTPGEPLPVVYYEARSRLPSVRADVVYFRQDFSVMHAVERPNRWPEVQRFDYLVQKRELTQDEIAAAQKSAQMKRSYPQHLAVRFALAQLNVLDRPEPRRRR